MQLGTDAITFLGQAVDKAVATAEDAMKAVAVASQEDKYPTETRAYFRTRAAALADTISELREAKRLIQQQYWLALAAEKKKP